MDASSQEDSFWSGRSRGARWISFAAMTTCCGMFTAMVSASSNDPGWPASALGVVGLVGVVVCVLAWAYRGTVEGEGDGLMPWFNGVPGWVGLTLAVIGFGCVAAGGYGYYVQDKEFLAAVQYFVVGFGIMALVQLLPRISWLSSIAEQRRSY